MTVYWTRALLMSLVAAVPAAPGADESLPQDPNFDRGRLANGVTWIYRHHDNPPDKMALMVHIDTGSLNETEAQRGVAHFIEHMCFNGTEHFAPGELIKYFESIGMEFGADLNAFTSFDQTAYMLFLPDTMVPQIDKGLMTLSDYVFRALLLDEEIDKERNVIMEEWRSRKSAQDRVFEKEVELVFAGTRFAERIPIGKPKVIEGAPRSEFVDYYRTWYRPENMTVMIVGDAPRDQIMPALRKWFGQYTADVAARPVSGPEFRPFSEQRAFVITDPELAGCEVSMYNISAGRPPLRTVKAYREVLVERIGSWMLNRRLRERVETGTATYRQARTAIRDFFRDAIESSCMARGEPGDWNAMLDEIIVEVARAREHGFAQSELELARKALIANAERAVQTEPTRNARQVLFSMNASVNRREPLLSAKQELDLLQRLLPTIPLEVVQATITERFGQPTFSYVITMPAESGKPAPSNEHVLAAARAAMSRSTEPWTTEKAPTDLLAAEPAPGTIEEKVTDKDLAITSAWMGNGVRLHHRFMDYKKDEVLVSVYLAGGEIQEDETTLGLTQMAASAVRRQPATSRLTSSNIRDIMTGKNIGVSAGTTRDGMVFSVRGSPKDVEVGLRLVHALLTDGKIEDSALRVWKQQQSQRYTMMQSYPEFKAFEALAESLSGNDPRMRPLLPTDRIETIQLADAQAWYRSLCRSAPIEVAFVGEISQSDAFQLAARYLGSLPRRDRRADNLDALRTLARSTGPHERQVKVKTVTPKAMAIAGFIGCDASNVTDMRGLEIASQILTSRLIEQIREELALVYSLRAMNRPATAYRDSGIFLTQARCDPANAARVASEAHRIYASFAADGPTAAELENACRQIENNLDEDMREPGYWSGVLHNLDYHGKNLQDEKDEPTAYRKYDAKAVTAVFRKYYAPTRRFTVTSAPITKKGEPAAQRQPKQPEAVPSGTRS